MLSLIGQSIGPYHILKLLGRGGLANVYKAHQTVLDRDVAFKIIRHDAFSPEQNERILKHFRREAKALARLIHPNIVIVFDFGDYEGSPYLVMEYLPGGTLAQKMGHPIPWQTAVNLLIFLAHAAEYAHQCGILHRDIKPSNILINAEGVPKLADFGFAKILEIEETHSLAGSGIGMGTPGYMAPEMMLAQPVDVRADVYSLGIIFYELVTGRKPYSADVPVAVILAQVNDPPPSPRKFVPDLPESVERVLFKVLAKKPEDRYQSMNAFAFALESLQVSVNHNQTILDMSLPDQTSSYFGRYKILEQLGQGSMGIVYKAYDTQSKRNVAVKVILPSKQQSKITLRRFELEAKALAQLKHPNIVHMNDFGEKDGTPFLVMDYLPGGTLQQRLGKPVPWSEAVYLCLPIARALELAHQHQIIHRDVKPSNILFSENGEPLLADFGVAKFLEAEETKALTATGIVLGTAEYMAPEYMTSVVTDKRVDIYALGVVLYELVVGRKPYQADTPLNVLYKHVNEALPRPKDFIPRLPDSVEQVILKALAKKLKDRYQNMGEFVSALDKLALGNTT